MLIVVLVFEILIPFKFYLVYYCHNGIVKSFEVICFTFMWVKTIKLYEGEGGADENRVKSHVSHMAKVRYGFPYGQAKFFCFWNFLFEFFFKFYIQFFTNFIAHWLKFKFKIRCRGPLKAKNEEKNCYSSSKYITNRFYNFTIFT